MSIKFKIKANDSISSRQSYNGIEILTDQKYTLNKNSSIIEIDKNVSDDEIKRAQSLLWENHRMLVEPAGAAALAAITSGKYKPKTDEKLAVLICGANPNIIPEF